MDQKIKHIFEFVIAIVNSKSVHTRAEIAKERIAHARAQVDALKQMVQQMRSEDFGK